jgi:alanyl-tRNA synthetase
MARQKAAARAAWKGSGDAASADIWFDIADELGGTEFTGYSGDVSDGEVVALVKAGARVTQVGEGEAVTILTNQTPFYGESGGQMGDAGRITGANGLSVLVEDTSKPLGRLHAHQGVVESGTISVGDTVTLSIDVERRGQLRANHSATHLLHTALRHRLGGHVTQKGSLVAPDRLRFDFAHNAALTSADIAHVESEVNARIRENDAVTTRLMTPDDAVAVGALALFGEKYGDEVRVLSMGRAAENHYSVELCGGTHVSALGDIALFKIVSESAVSSGVRRIEALTGEAARHWLTKREDRLKEAAAMLKAAPDDVPARVSALVEAQKKLERELAEAKKALALGGGSGAGPAVEDIAGVKFEGQLLDGFDPKGLRGLIDEAKTRLGSGIAAVVTVNDARASVAIGVTDDLKDRLSAVDIVKAAVTALGGQGGGGRPDMAQGGGPDGAAGAEALAAVRAAIESAAVAA